MPISHTRCTGAPIIQTTQSAQNEHMRPEFERHPTPLHAAQHTQLGVHAPEVLQVGGEARGVAGATQTAAEEGHQLGVDGR